MKRILVISDIHGEVNMFNDLLKKVKYKKDKDQLILLGDYIDRGPDSKAVVERVIKLKKEGAIALLGNHEAMLLETVDGDNYGRERYQRNGGLETVKSYDNTIETFKLPDTNKFQEHVEFIRNLDLYYETENYVFVHAGVVPEKKLADTSQDELLWIRDEFFKNYNGEKTVIFGHTPTNRLHNNKSFDPYFGENKIIGIDGGAVFGGQLNCLVLPEKTFMSIRKQ